MYFFKYKELASPHFVAYIVSMEVTIHGGGGSRTPVLTVHPSTSTGLDPADESRFPAAVGQS